MPTHVNISIEPGIRELFLQQCILVQNIPVFFCPRSSIDFSTCPHTSVLTQQIMNLSNIVRSVIFILISFRLPPRPFLLDRQNILFMSVFRPVTYFAFCNNNFDSWTPLHTLKYSHLEAFYNHRRWSQKIAFSKGNMRFYFWQFSVIIKFICMSFWKKTGIKAGFSFLFWGKYE